MKNKILLLFFVVIPLHTTMLTGCWNYREIDRMTIVAGLAIDKGKNSKYILTAEIVEIGGGKEFKLTSRQITMEGNTMFDAVRNGISIAGRKLYWGHTKVIILSKKIAREGVIKVLDWITRDSETRADVVLLVSEEKSAKDIFAKSKGIEQLISYELETKLKSQKMLSKALTMDVWDFINKLEAPGIVAILPTIHLSINRNQKLSPAIIGTAIFKRDKLIGFLNGEETKNLMFILNEVKGGLFITSLPNGKQRTPVSLEIFKSKTSIQPIFKKNKMGFNIQINTTTALDEINGSIKNIDDKTIKQIEHQAEKDLITRVEESIHHVQTSFGVDIFGFGAKLREENPKLWNQVENRWGKEYFKELAINVNAKVHIKGSGILLDSIEKGDL
ncbi:Ger(x)C family spore germination protein [Neobacillus niacini]|uniref:Ger(x)C family spore germination protein n=1 Tax=Neobacillus niacini TaxID=86668 RepID=UPI0028602434|nr:Ger(x)C family spore germination protein [Neobacillus niacini]MDR7001020.1 spore germination protein KC [Neobacillus niacini]